MNKVILTGNICRDCELVNTASGKPLLINIIAVQRDFKNANGEYDTDFIHFTAWDNNATFLSQYAKKGDKVELVGRWETGSYETANGEKRPTNKCIIETIRLINKAKFEAVDNLDPYAEKQKDNYDLPF